MRTLLMASAAVLALGGSAALHEALAQNAPNNPRSATASNITSGNTHSQLAPALPSPGGPDAAAEQYLNRARQALRAGHTGEAQEALERAETRLLDRSTVQGSQDTPDSNPRVQAVNSALHALAQHDRAGALHNIEMAMNTAGNEGAISGGAPGSEPTPATPLPSSTSQSGISSGPGPVAQGGAVSGSSNGPQPAPQVPSGLVAVPVSPPGIGTGAPPTTGTAAGNTQLYSSCPTPPCVQGTPPAAPGGGSGSGPAALRTATPDSPVGTGAGQSGNTAAGAKGP